MTVRASMRTRRVGDLPDEAVAATAYAVKAKVPGTPAAESLPQFGNQ